MTETFFTLLLALVVDFVVGDPQSLYRTVPHPVVLIGRVIDTGERRLNRPDLSRGARFVNGVLLAIGVAVLAAAVGWVIQGICKHLSWGWWLLPLIASSLIAFRGLYDHVKAVADGLGRSLDDGRRAVGEIVGRDPSSLDEAGVARAAIESAAENFSDGVVAPVFWYALLGLPGLCAYKAINTLDSMIGHRSERYETFGKAAARLDDAVNWLPARIAGLLFVLAAAVLSDTNGARAWRTMRRDADKHRSPNAGWPEAAAAGALGLALAGPRRYGGELAQDHWMGEGRADLTVRDVRAALRLYLAAGVLLVGIVAANWFLSSSHSA